MSLSPGTRLGQFEILTPLGAGGMGEAYRARDTKLQRGVALKILPESFAGDRDRLARFEREAVTLATLNHPNIAQIYRSVESETQTALVMEFVDGDDLAARLTRGPMPVDESLVIARQVAEALDAAHSAGIVHRTEAGERQSPQRRHGQGAGFRVGQGAGFGSGRCPH
jgi:serine/threonine protein kinase